MKYISRFLLIILAILSLTNLQADHSIQFNLDNDPRFHVEFNLPEDYLITRSTSSDMPEISFEHRNKTVIGMISFQKKHLQQIFL